MGRWVKAIGGGVAEWSRRRRAYGEAAGVRVVRVCVWAVCECV